MKTIFLTLILTTILAHADDLWVYERQPTKPSAVHRGLVNGRPCLIQIYGSDAIEQAQRFGRLQADIKHPFLFVAQAIKDRAAERYPGQTEMQRWFIADAAKSYDAEVKNAR